MIYQITDPTKMIETLASLILKGQTDLSDVLVFVPTQRSARSLEKNLAQNGALVLPKIVPLGEPFGEIETISNLERKIVLAELLLSVSDKFGIKSNLSNVLPVASELISLEDYLENEGINIKNIEWENVIKDERKAKFLNCIKELDLGLPTETVARNVGIRNWINELSKYKAVFCCGSTASVSATRDLMTAIAKLNNGTIILPGLLKDNDDIGRTDPYWTIKQFLKAGNFKIETIDVGNKEKISFFNDCFNNDISGKKLKKAGNLTQIDCATESLESEVVGYLSDQARANGKKVLIITPDISGQQRIVSVLKKYGIKYDSSSGMPLYSTNIGRFIELCFEYLTKNEKQEVVRADLDELCDTSLLGELKYDNDLLDFAVNAISKLKYNESSAEEVETFFLAISDLSEFAKKYKLDLQSVAVMMAEILKNEAVRGKMDDDYDVVILGTAESRMQNADVVILTGLNDGVFPSGGFQHNWLPRDISYKLGLPSTDSKVSLQALDFMTLSCNKEVFWTRTKMSGGSATIQSRFLSRVSIKSEINKIDEIISDDVLLNPIDKTPPVHNYKGAYYATWLESLIHNPYLFYAKHILHLRKNPDIGDDLGAKEFGTMIHSVIQKLAEDKISDAALIEQRLIDFAVGLIGKDNVLFRFWKNRFHDMAPLISEMLKTNSSAESEKKIETKYSGKTLFAIADRIENASKVIDYKTGRMPTDTQLGLGKDENCTMPQLPLEAMMLQDNTKLPVSMAFLGLARNNLGLKEYDHEKTLRSINAVKKKLNEVLDKTTYIRPEHEIEEKYRDFDDLARVED